MSEDGGLPVKRPKLYKDEYEKLNKEDLLQRLYEQDGYIETLLSKQGDGNTGEKESSTPQGDAEEKLKQQQVEATRRENVLVMRLTTKEQEMQEYLNQIQELKQTKNPATAQLRGMLLDPAINLMFQRMRKEMDSCKEKLEQAQNDLAAWKFTPDSQTGKRLMAKCRMLLQENEELGKVISTGRTAKLEGEIALEKKFVEEMKTSQAETDEFLVEMDEDLEGMQSTILFLQLQLKEAKDEVAQLQQEKIELRQQLQQSLSQPAFPHQYNTDTSKAGRDSAPNTSQLSPTSNVDAEAGRDSYGPAEHCDSAEGQRTSGVTASSTVGYMSHHHTGNNVSSRTNSEYQGEGIVSSSNSEQRTQYNTAQSSTGGANTDDYSRSQQQVRHPCVDESRNTDSATNGDHSVMETSRAEEPQSSCEDDTQQGNREQSNCHSPQGAGTVNLSPGPVSSNDPVTSQSYNHATYRTPHSSDAYTFEAMDASSEDWSPSNQSKTSGMVSDDDQRGSVGEKYRTDSKGGTDRLHNGLVAVSQYEAPEEEIAN